jgi:hypothetical protein
VALAEESMRN